MAKAEPPRRRFAPVHIETTFESVRFPKQPGQVGPNPELTPEPSPRSPSPTLDDLLEREKRRFAPQLIETSRRARRVGDVGPATRPTDKTDITPYTNHIYVHRSKSRKRLDDQKEEVRAPTRRESEDEEISGYLLDLAAREAERQIHIAALAAFPNSGAREGGVNHFFYRENSGDDTTPESSSPAVPGMPAPSRPHPPYDIRTLRRKSSDLTLTWWHKNMQEHAELLAKQRGDDEPEADMETAGEDGSASDAELDAMELEGPPEDTLWLTSKKKTTHRSSTRGSMPGPGQRGPIGEFVMPLIAPDPYVTADHRAYVPPPSPTFVEPIGESFMPYIPSAPPGKALDMDYRPAPVAVRNIPPETDFRSGGERGGYGMGFGAFARPFGDVAETEFRTLRKAASPPMLGEKLEFRKCLSPKQTKLEPDHPFGGEDADEKNRDLTGQGGLWRGYCYRNSTSDTDLVPAALHAPAMLHTPRPPSSPGDPFNAAFGSLSMSEEPASITSSATETTTTTAATSLTNSGSSGRSSLLTVPNTVEHRGRSTQPKGLHMLHGLDERLRREKAQAERDEKIAAEFNDSFITQVFNYLSLGYPALARAFDPELAKISRISIDELQKADEEVMVAKGYLKELDPKEATPEEERSPRWRALKVYIYEWARQHPDLDSMDPLAWGVRERRGSWAI